MIIDFPASKSKQKHGEAELVDNMLENSKGQIKSGAVIGYDKDWNLYVDSTCGLDQLVTLLEQVKICLLTGDEKWQ